MDEPIMEGEVMHIGDIPIADGLASEALGGGCGEDADSR